MENNETIDINEKREILQDYYYKQEYTIKERIFGILYWFVKLILFSLAILFIYQNIPEKKAELIIFALFSIYYFLYKEYSSIKYKYYDKVFEYSEILHQIEINKLKKEN